MHSSVNFNIKHMGISFVQGRFDKFDGRVATSGASLDKADLSFSVS
ncbi:YceI family protein, partial [Chryseobacterium sp. CH1]